MIKDMLFFHREIKNSNDSYEFADNFLDKILDDLIEHKNKKLSLNKKYYLTLEGLLMIMKLIF